MMELLKCTRTVTRYMSHPIPSRSTPRKFLKALKAMHNSVRAADMLPRHAAELLAALVDLSRHPASTGLLVSICSPVALFIAPAARRHFLQQRRGHAGVVQGLVDCIRRCTEQVMV